MPAAFHCRHHLPTISGGEGAGAALPLNPHYLHDHPLCPRSQPNLRDRNSSHEIGAILIAYEDLGYVPHNLTVGFNRDSIQESIDALSLIFCLEFNSIQQKLFAPCQCELINQADCQKLLKMLLTFLTLGGWSGQ